MLWGAPSGKGAELSRPDEDDTVRLGGKITV